MFLVALLGSSLEMENTLHLEPNMAMNHGVVAPLIILLYIYPLLSVYLPTICNEYNMVTSTKLVFAPT
jgi:hypothetical protein